MYGAKGKKDRNHLSVNELRVERSIYLFCRIKKIGIWFALRPDDRIISDRAANTPRAHPWHHLPKGCAKGRHRCTSWCNTTKRLISRQKHTMVHTWIFTSRKMFGIEANNKSDKFIILKKDFGWNAIYSSTDTISSIIYFVKDNLNILLSKITDESA